MSGSKLLNWFNCWWWLGGYATDDGACSGACTIGSICIYGATFWWLCSMFLGSRKNWSPSKSYHWFWVENWSGSQILAQYCKETSHWGKLLNLYLSISSICFQSPFSLHFHDIFFIFLNCVCYKIKIILLKKSAYMYEIKYENWIHKS